MKDNTKRILAIVIAVVCIGGIITYYFMSNRKIDYSNVKKEKNKDIVYTISSLGEDDVFKKEIPYLNLNFDITDSINQEVEEYTFDLKEQEKATISYNYEVNGEVLSYLIKMIDYDNEEGPIPYFKSYNINLKTKKLVSDDELLGLYNYDYDDVESSIEKGFKKYYKELVKKKYQNPDECDYECFLEFREVDNYLDDVVYYVSRGNLYAIKPFSFYSVKGEEEYFTEDHFNFVVTKKES